MTTPPPYGSTPGQQGYPGGSSPAGSTGGSSAGWTPPASGDAQGYGPPQGQQQYGQQPSGQQYGQQPGYPQQSYPPAPGYPAAGYPGGPGGYPGGPGGVGTARPGMVTAAAVLAFVWGGFAIIAGLVIVAASSVLSAASSTCNSIDTNDANTTAACNAVSSYSGFFKVITAGLVVIAILLIWGGVVALTGKNGQILVIGAAIYILLDIISIIVSISNNTFGSTGVIGIAAPVLILVFMLNPRSKAWFKAKGAKTF